MVTTVILPGRKATGERRRPDVRKASGDRLPGGRGETTLVTGLSGLHDPPAKWLGSASPAFVLEMHAMVLCGCCSR